MAFNVQISERVATLESHQENQGKRLEVHDALIIELDTKLDKLIDQVSGVRTALILMAGSIAANVPALQPMFVAIKHLFSV